MSGIVGNNLGRASGLVKSGGVGADAVDSANIADDAIDSEHYTNASIDNAHLADSAVDTDEIADNAVSLAKMASGTDEQIITYDASGNPSAVGPGSDGQVLTSTGAGSPPAFEAAAGGGLILQVVQATKTDTYSTTSATWATVTDLSVSITPASSSNKVLVMYDVTCGHPAGSGHSYIKVVRGTTDIFRGDANGSTPRAVCNINQIGTPSMSTRGCSFLDSPSTTSSITYNVYGKTTSTFTVNRSYDNTANSDHDGTGASSITVMEVKV